MALLKDWILPGMLVVLALTPGCSREKGAESAATAEPAVQMADLVMGEGAALASGDYFTVHYKGWLWVDGQKGEVFEDTYQFRSPPTFRLGRDQVIPGWDEGLLGMRVGGKRSLLLPPEKGFGSVASARIPPGSTLYFEIELLDIPTVQHEVLVPTTGPLAEEGDQVDIHYTAWIAANGEKGMRFDSTHDRGTSFSFSLGAGQVLNGLDLGVTGMQVGEKRLIRIPPALGYGERGMQQGGRQVVPPDATLLFEVELLSILGK